MLGGRARLYCQGRISDHEQDQWEFGFRPLFEMHEAKTRIRIDGRRSTLLLLVERVARFEPGELKHQLREGARRLLEMRGWRLVDARGDGLEIADRQRQFSVAILDAGEPPPQEDPLAQTPGLGRAPVLVVHPQPKREQLLIGNRGQFFHVALEDIALMEPDTTWVWRVLRRQLLENTGKLTLAALRLAAALIVEAIRMGRVQTSIMDVDWADVERVMGADDCERFVAFHERGIQRGVAMVTANVSTLASSHGRAFIELMIEDDGPAVTANVYPY